MLLLPPPHIPHLGGAFPPFAGLSEELFSGFISAVYRRHEPDLRYLPNEVLQSFNLHSKTIKRGSFMETMSLATLVLCFCGGIISASLGAIFAFVICGLLVLSGCIVVMAGGSDFLLLQVGLGPIFGPHTGGFAAGVAACTYAAGMKKNHPTGAGKDVLAMLTDTSWDVLLVGGVAAVFGHVVLQLLTKIPVINMADCIALTVVISNVLSRLLFQKEGPFGSRESIKEHGLLGTNNFAISWVPWMAPLSRSLPIGFAVGAFSVALAMGTKEHLAPLVSAGTVSATAAFVVPLILGWTVGVIAFLPLLFGNSDSNIKTPIVHGMGIISALSYMLFGDKIGVEGAILLGAGVGIAYTLLQELMARLFYNHGSNHVDPPACTIATATLLLNGIKHFVG